MIVVLRLGHRINRDKRITTHVALVARAFGADKISITTKDKKIEENIHAISTKFGGAFSIESGVNPKKIINQWNGEIVHLTMYGEDLEKTIEKLDKTRDMLIIVGAEKVAPYFYEKADFNISVGNQPHSEVAALAIFLDRYFKGKWLTKQFNGKIEIIPSDTRKTVISKKRVI
jgi:tRNA (cytidine56-2'-O)-methyltransferase